MACHVTANNPDFTLTLTLTLYQEGLEVLGLPPKFSAQRFSASYHLLEVLTLTLTLTLTHTLTVTLTLIFLRF